MAAIARRAGAGVPRRRRDAPLVHYVVMSIARFAIAVMWVAACGRIFTDSPIGACATGETCVAAIPTGWSGYVVLYDGPTDSVPACPPPFIIAPSPGGADPVGAPATCSACVCGAQTGGSCPPAGGAAQLSAPTFNRTAVTCDGVSGASCAGGSCQLVPSTPFASGVCVEQAGDVGCPMPFADRHLFFASISDMRGCTSCECAPPMAGVCVASAAMATGSVVGTGPTTVCCTP